MSEAPESSPIPVLVSACLLGRACRYDGRHNHSDPLLSAMRERGEVPIPFCPEEHGGLGTPRPPAWIEHGSAAEVLDGTSRVLTDSGADVTREFVRGAEGALRTCQEHGIEKAYLKERSPSCGVANTHVKDTVAEGPGVTGELLSRHGISTEGC